MQGAASRVSEWVVISWLGMSYPHSAQQTLPNLLARGPGWPWLLHWPPSLHHRPPHVFTSTKITEYHRKYSGCETNNLNSYLLELEPAWPFSSAFLSVQVWDPVIIPDLRARDTRVTDTTCPEFSHDTETPPWLDLTNFFRLILFNSKKASSTLRLILLFRRSFFSYYDRQ